MRGFTITMAAWAAVFVVAVPVGAAAQSATGSVNAANVVTASRTVQAGGKTDRAGISPAKPVTSTVTVGGTAGVAGARASFSKSFDLKGLFGLFHKGRPKPAPASRPASPQVVKVRSGRPPQAAGAASSSVSAAAAAPTPVPAPSAVVAATPAAVAPDHGPPSPLPLAGGAAALALLAGGGFALGKSGLARSAARHALHRLRPPHIQVHGHMAPPEIAKPEFETHTPAVAFILRSGPASTHLTFLDSETT